MAEPVTSTQPITAAVALPPWKFNYCAGSEFQAALERVTSNGPITWGQQARKHLETYAANAAHVLDQAGICNILWGNILLTVYGVPSGLCDIAFVVPDEQLEAAISALHASGLVPCPDPQTCFASQIEHTHNSLVLRPHVHFTEADYISLHKRSETLWKIPTSAIPAADQAPTKDIIFASDPALPHGYRPARGRGAFSKSLYPVRVPSVYRITEAYFLLMERHRYDRVGDFYDVMQTYLGEYVHADGMLDVTQLEPRHAKYVKAMQTNDRALYDEVMDELETELARST